MDMTLYALLMGKIKGLSSGVVSSRVEGTDLILTFANGTSQVISFPKPKDGISITDIKLTDDKELICYLSDGTEIISGQIQTIKGDPFTYNDFTQEQLENLKGKSAYQIALDNGFIGTEQDWLDSLGGKVDPNLYPTKAEVITIIEQQLENSAISAEDIENIYNSI